MIGEMHFKKEGEPLNEAKLLKQMRRGSTDALCTVIDQYAPYVAAIVTNICGTVLTAEDIEETVSDVFYSLWQHADKVRTGKLKAYLVAIDRNTAKNKLRSLHAALPLEEDALDIPVPDGEPEAEALRHELQQETRAAVDTLPDPDREIMLRYYYCCQSTADIAHAMNLNPSTITTKLARSREKLRRHLTERGYIHEASHL